MSKQTFILTATRPDGTELRKKLHVSDPNFTPEKMLRQVTVVSPMGELKSIDPSKITVEGPFDTTLRERREAAGQLYRMNRVNKSESKPPTA